MNFSNSNIWNTSLTIRYPIDKIVNIGQLYFYNDNAMLICQNFFNLNIGKIEIDELIKKIKNGSKIKFKYLNDSKALEDLKKMAIDNKFIFKVIDSWESPRLILKNNLTNYLLTECGTQIKRNFKLYQKNQKNKIFGLCIKNRL